LRAEAELIEQARPGPAGFRWRQHPPGSRVDSPSAPRPPVRRRWIRPGPAPSCLQVTAVGSLALVVFGTALLEHIPSAAIGAIVGIVGIAVLPLLGVADFRQLWRLDRAEFLVGAVCCGRSPDRTGSDRAPLRRSSLVRQQHRPG
ncbi:MAG TPA: hypothetical protein VIT42_09125, partial [Microlunatus sp.]